MPFFVGGGGAAASNMVGATSSTAGTAGLVPAPAAGDDSKILFGSATFKEPSFPEIGLVSGTYIGTMDFAGVTGSGGFSLNRLYYSIIWVPKTTTFDRIGISTSTSHATNPTTIRLGIYNINKTDGTPSTVALDAGTLNISGASAFYEITGLSIQLNRGFYYGVCNTGANTINCYRMNQNQTVGLFRATTNTANSRFFYTQLSSDTSSSQFASNPSINNDSNTGQPWIRIRVA